MAAGVGHEINNPLAIGVGNIHQVKRMLKNENIDNPKIFSGIKKLEASNERIRKIVDGLRSYARTDSDEPELVSMKEAIDQTLTLLSEIYEKDGITIINENPENDLHTLGSIGKLQQIIMNFISNAKDATLGRPDRRIHISLIKNSFKTLKLSIKDNGEGIPESIKNKILEPFFTTKELGKGTGMGLSVTNELIKKMDGSLEILSTLGQGSTFCVTLPLVDSSIKLKNTCKNQMDITST